MMEPEHLLSSRLSGDLLAHLIPYLIIVANFALFKLLRSFVNRLFRQVSFSDQVASNCSDKRRQRQPKEVEVDEEDEEEEEVAGPVDGKAICSKRRLMKLLISELLSTCELCADCAELNVVYEKHGSLAYGLSLFLLTYLWIDAFGDAQTTPGYLAEDYFLIKGNELLKSGDVYARFVGQSLAMPLAWRLAKLYWNYQLIAEHGTYLADENCKSSLSTSTANGFLVEFTCCLVCRLAELVGQRLLERHWLSQRLVSLGCSFVCSGLVVLALELSGGYFNPVLAASLEFGCQGIELHQHLLVFWLGPLLGHVLARALFRRYAEQLVVSDDERQRQPRPREAPGGQQAQAASRRRHSQAGPQAPKRRQDASGSSSSNNNNNNYTGNNSNTSNASPQRDTAGRTQVSLRRQTRARKNH